MSFVLKPSFNTDCTAFSKASASLSRSKEYLNAIAKLNTVAIGFDKRNEAYPQLTDHYFTGDYPVKPVDELGDNKITQLSLLSTASNN